MPDIIIVAGPNGAGKSTFIREFLPGIIAGTFIRLDADEIERLLDPTIIGVDRRALAAGRLLLQRIEEVIESRDNLLLETTLTLRTYARRIPRWKSNGYRVHLIYLKLPSVETSLERVGRRVAQGGHNIPVEAIRRRFEKSLDYLENIYKPIVDVWYIWESLEGDFKPLSAWDLP